MNSSCRDSVDEFESSLSAILPGGVITANIHHSAVDPVALFAFGARANSKRAFLFLSKVLGKHLPVCPSRMLDIHERIARLIPSLPEPIVFVGMAETATGLGQGVFEAWLAGRPGAAGVFVHTTRYRIAGIDLVEFDEPHSHAPRIYLHVPTHAPARSQFLSARSLILIDDEISTGQTLENLSAAFAVRVPSVERVHLACITDFMGPERRLALADRFGRETGICSLLYGEYSFDARASNSAEPAGAQHIAGNRISIADNGFGRLGRTSPLTVPKSLVKSLDAGGARQLPTLVLGTGEFMHAAHVLARTLQRLGHSVVVQATTRSPILQWGPIESMQSFPDNYGEGIPNYIYGLDPARYGQILVCCETDIDGHLNRWVGQIGGRLIHFTSETSVEEASLC